MGIRARNLPRQTRAGRRSVLFEDCRSWSARRSRPGWNCAFKLRGITTTTTMLPAKRQPNLLRPRTTRTTRTPIRSPTPATRPTRSSARGPLPRSSASASRAVRLALVASIGIEASGGARWTGGRRSGRRSRSGRTLPRARVAAGPTWVPVAGRCGKPRWCYLLTPHRGPAAAQRRRRALSESDKGVGGRARDPAAAAAQERLYEAKDHAREAADKHAQRLGASSRASIECRRVLTPTRMRTGSLRPRVPCSVLAHDRHPQRVHSDESG